MINYVIGDATEPVKKPAIIAHVNNDIGAWGVGFTAALDKKWKEPKKLYRVSRQYALPGSTCLVHVETDIYVANMIAQQGLRSKENPVPLRYDWLQQCLVRLCELAKNIESVTIHMPKIGAGLAGGDWLKIETLIVEHLAEEVDVYIYELKRGV